MYSSLILVVAYRKMYSHTYRMNMMQREIDSLSLDNIDLRHNVARMTYMVVLHMQVLLDIRWPSDTRSAEMAANKHYSDMGIGSTIHCRSTFHSVQN